MIRKILFAGAGVFLVGTLLFGHGLRSYIKTSAGWVKTSVKESVPLTFEIDRARQIVRDLEPEIRKNKHVIAKEEVAIEQLNQQIARSEEKLAKDRGELKRLKSDLASDKDRYEYGGRTFTVSQVKNDLANRFERFKTADATLASLREIHSARERSLDAARQKLEGMLATKRKLEVDVENLEARLKMIEVAQTTSSYNFDDSQLSQAKELVTDLRTRLDVAEKIIGAETTYTGEIALDDTTSSNILEQVTEYLDAADGKVGSTAAAE